MHWFKKAMALAAVGASSIGASSAQERPRPEAIPVIRLGTPTPLNDSGIVRAFTPIPSAPAIVPASYVRPIVARGAAPSLDDEPKSLFLPRELPPLDESKLIWPTPPSTQAVQTVGDKSKEISVDAEKNVEFSNPGTDRPLSPGDDRIIIVDPSGNPIMDSGYGGPNRFYARAEWLHWWTRGFRLPPLILTDSPNTPLETRGLPGNGTTRFLLGNSDTSAGGNSGARFTLGYNLDPCGLCAIEANFFFLGRKNDNHLFTSSEFPVLGRPFFDLNDGIPNRELTTSPNLNEVFAGTGSVRVDTSSSLFGAEVNLRRQMSGPCSPFRFTALAGFRFLNLSEHLGITETTAFLTNIPLTPPDVPLRIGDVLTNFDRFSTQNRFFGGQIGGAAEWTRDRWTIEARVKLGLGATFQSVDIDGGQRIVRPGAANQNFVGGLYALPSNIGHHSQSRLGFVPEVGVSVGYQLTENIRVFAGYDFLYWSSVVRPGDQIDPVLDLNQVPQAGRPYPPASQVRPRVPFQTSGYWAQGINAGLMIRY